MQTISINVKDAKVMEKVTWLLEHLRSDGVEIIDREDLEDLKLIKATRQEKSILFEDYLKHED